MNNTSRYVEREAKKAISFAVLYFLYCGLYELSKNDSRVKAEIDSWEEGLTFCLKTGDNCPSLTIMKRSGGIERIADAREPDVVFTFKNLEKAFIVLTGRQSVAHAYAAHSFSLRGDIGKGMSFARCVDLAERYLFPPVITDRILKEKAEKQYSSIALYAKIMTGSLGLKYKAVSD